MPVKQSTRRSGRPPAGAREGEKVKDYPQLSVRVPPGIKARLDAMAVVCARPQWRVITAAVLGHCARLTDEEQRLVEEILERRHHRDARTTLAGEFPVAGGSAHAVRFYDEDDKLCRLVAAFVAEGLALRQPVIAIVTPHHRAMIETHLRAGGLDADALIEARRFFVLDAHRTLDEILIDGMPDPVRFRRTLLPLIEHATAGRTDGVIRAYGEMVDILWQSGLHAAAIRLEELWNALGRTYALSLMCAYAVDGVDQQALTDDLKEVRRHHSHVVAEDGALTAVL